MRIIENQTFDMERALYGSKKVPLKKAPALWRRAASSIFAIRSGIITGLKFPVPR